MCQPRATCHGTYFKYNSPAPVTRSHKALWKAHENWPMEMRRFKTTTTKQKYGEEEFKEKAAEGSRKRNI